MGLIDRRLRSPPDAQVALLLVGIGLVAAPARAQAPADFKILVGAYGLGPNPVHTEEMISLAGRVYLFASNSREIQVIEPGRKRVEFLDFDRKLQTELTFEQLDEGLTKVKRDLAEAVERREKTGKRADRVEAQMTRDLLEPRLKLEAGADGLKLTNPTVEVEARGEPDADPARLAIIRSALIAVAKVGAYRTPDDLPPFVEIEAVEALTGDRKLRPIELSYLYRLAGPPRKFRRTYQLFADLTDRDREAIRRVDRLRETTPVVRLEKYRTAR